MRTYSPLVDPTDLRLKLREAHEQNYVIIPLVARSSCFHRFRRVWGAGDVSPDMA